MSTRLERFRGLLMIQKRQKKDRFSVFQIWRRKKVWVEKNLEQFGRPDTWKSDNWKTCILVIPKCPRIPSCFFCLCFCSLCVSVFLMQKVLTIQSLFMRAITLLVFSFFFALLVIYGQIVEILVHTHTRSNKKW